MSEMNGHVSVANGVGVASVPRTTESNLPSGEGVAWTRKSYGFVASEIQKTAPRWNSLRRSLADRLISVWHIEMGADPDTASGISMAEFLARAYTTGTYYVRFSHPSPTDLDTVEDCTYFTCSASAEGGGGDVLSSVQKLEQALSRGLDAAAAFTTIQSEQNQALLKSNTDLRAEIHTKDFDIAEKDRRIAQLESELEQAREDSAPIFDEDNAIAFLNLFNMWANGGGEGTKERLFARLFIADIKLVQRFQSDTTIMKRIAEHHPDAWDAWVAVVNDVAKAANPDKPVRMSSSEHIVKALGAKPARNVPARSARKKR